jgi:hypothetical protein
MIMISKKLLAVPTLMGALLIAGSGQKAHADSSNMTLEVQNFTTVTATPTLSMTPTLADIVAGSIETASGIGLNVVTNNGTGCKITVSAGAAGTNKIAPADIFLKVANAGNGTETGSFAAYTALDTVAADLWNTTAAQLNGTDVDLDVRFANLSAYPAQAGATTNYTNTITFTAVANS